MTLIKPILFFALATLALGCGKAGEDSAEKHDPGRFLNSIVPYQWREVSEETYRASEENVIPTDHAMTIRLQAWADAIRANMLLSTHALTIAPRPLIRVARNAEVNAHAATVSVCIDTPITFKVGSTAPVFEDTSYIQGSTFLTSGPRREGCEKYEGTLEDSFKFVSWAVRGVEGCHVSLGNKQLVMSEACGKALPNDNYSGFQIDVAENYLTVNTGLLESLPEVQVVATLAHELAHYYMGHANAAASQYNYFYERNLTNSTRKPIPLGADSPLLNLAEGVLAAIQAKESDETIATLIQAATDKGIGYYTVEQEADEIATEEVYRLGLDPHAVISMALSIGMATQPKEVAVCKANFDTGFKKPEWIGDLADPHHDFCYRAYNSFEELLYQEDYYKKYQEQTTPQVQAGLTWEAALTSLKTDQL